MSATGRSVTVRVPATSANLGTGFDALEAARHEADAAGRTHLFDAELGTRLTSAGTVEARKREVLVGTADRAVRLGELLPDAFGPENL